jgi:uncharacterized protein
MAHPHEDLLRRGYAAFASGDLDTVKSIMADDIVWHIGGASQLAGDYHGQAEVMGFFGKVTELSAGTFHLEIHDVLANDEHGTVLVTAHGERDGQSLAARTVHIWHLAGGKFTEFWGFYEKPDEVDAFFG